jgi:dUTP pyrophosphatase
MHTLISQTLLHIATNNTIAIPEYATEHSAGLDLIASIKKQIVLSPGKITRIPTGLKTEIPVGCFGLLASRSGLSTKHGIMLINGVGIIDSDYRGEIKCPLINLSQTPYIINPGDRIAQLIIVPYLKAHLKVTPELSNTERGVGGFGSTGK